MFRTAELGRSVSAADYKARVPALRSELLELQRALRAQGQSQVIIDFAGVDAAGKGETVDLLNAWMDARWLVTQAYGLRSDEERERPRFWRIWRDLPPRGQIGLYLSGRYSEPLLSVVHGATSSTEFDLALNRIVNFEKALANDGALILKFWMHLSAKAQKKRLKKLEKDPLTAWRVSEKDWAHYKLYDEFIGAAERLIKVTSTGRAPWHIVEGQDSRYRSLTVGTIIRDAIAAHLDRIRVLGEVAAAGNDAETSCDAESDALADLTGRTILDTLDMQQRLDKPDYKRQLKKYQARLAILRRKMQERGISSLIVVEGPDAAGKGGAIRRVIEPLPARTYKIIPFAAPTDEERAQHYLWRFWRHLSRAGRLTVYDRSWYGRVLVERVEGFATTAEWSRAYAEINDFEEQVIEHGTVLSKFWIHVTKDEQLARFEARRNTPHKAWKLTDEDWRNREKWDDYLRATHDMIERTSTREAPWTLVEGNDKYFARVKVVKTLCAQYQQALKTA